MYAAAEAIAELQVAPVSEVCQILNVSRSSYYAWRGAKPTKREDDDLELAPLVRAIFPAIQDTRSRQAETIDN